MAAAEKTKNLLTDAWNGHESTSDISKYRAIIITSSQIIVLPDAPGHDRQWRC